MSSYKKLKKENEKLMQDIRALVMFPDDFKSAVIRAEYKSRFQTESVLWFGDPSVLEPEATDFKIM